jgi:hypothetical protein
MGGKDDANPHSTDKVGQSVTSFGLDHTLESHRKRLGTRRIVRIIGGIFDCIEKHNLPFGQIPSAERLFAMMREERLHYPVFANTIKG